MRSGERIGLLVLLLAGFVLRLALAFTASDDALLSVDGREYREISVHLAAGQGFSIASPRWFEAVAPDAPSPRPDLFRPPLLPLCGALLVWLPGAWEFHARWAAALLGALGILVVYGIARELFDRRVARLAASAWALYPPACLYAARWSTESLAFLCIGAATWLALGNERRNARRALAIGIAAGLAVLARPNLLGPVVLLAAVFGYRWGARQVLWIALAALCLLAPWMARSYRLTGAPNPATSFGAYNAWLGMNECVHEMYADTAGSSFTAWMQRLFEVESRARVEELQARGIFDPLAVQRFWWGEAAEYAEAHPEEALGILARRALHFFQPHPMPATATALELALALASTGVAMLLALWALWRDPRAREPLFAALVLGGLLAALPFVFHLRLRFPILDPVVVVLAARGLTLLRAKAK